MNDTGTRSGGRLPKGRAGHPLRTLTASTALAAALAAAVVALPGAPLGAPPAAGAQGGGGDSSSSGSSAPGVTPTSINVGAISTLTGPISANFADFVPGVKAYFSWLDAKGGVNGRKINLQWSLDDQGLPSQFTADAHTLIDQDHAFAAFMSSYWFSPGLFVSARMPTYGYNTSGNWAGPPNLFASNQGSVIYFPGGVPGDLYLISKVHAKSVAVLAYNVSSSKNACQAAINGFQKAGVKVSYQDLAVPVDGNITPAIQHVQQAGSDFVLSCMDVQENISMAKAIHQYGLKVTQEWLNGNDQAVLDANSAIMQNVYFTIQYVPLTAPISVYPAVGTYLSAMKKYQPRYVGDSLAVQGWEAASLFAAGVKAAGSNLTQQRVIDLTNQFTAFNAGGITTPVNWTTAHSQVHPPFCLAFIKVSGKRYVPALAPGKQVFLCFNGQPVKNPKPVKPPAGTPGAS